jgi:cellulose synthase (UDP-forming)
MKKYWLFLPLTVLLLGINYLLLHHFNTLVWPYVWPRPGIFILIGFFVFVLWFRELFAGAWLLRIVGLVMIFIGQSYLLHSFEITLEQFSLIALLHLIGVTGSFFVIVINFFNQMMPKSHRQPPPLPEELPYIAAVIPTYGEPYDVLEKTVVSVKELDYPSERLHIVISDDGHRDEIRRLAEIQGVHYNKGAKKDAKAGNLNSALAYLDQHFPQASLILTQDADEVLNPSFLKSVVGYFNDPKIAFVQTPKEALTPPGDPFGNRDRIFYDIIQPGRNGSGSAFACGSGVLWRIEAIKAIGGFVTWNIVEDLTTSYFLHSAGYRSEYYNKILSVGLSPDDIPGLLKQRGTWAADTWRLFLFNNPLLKPDLSLRQRLQYLELGLFYLSSVFIMPLLMIIPILSLATGQFIPIEGSALFPWIAIYALYYIVLARGQTTYLVRMWQYWIGHWPTYTKAFWIAVRSRHEKPSYKVTRKTRQDGFYGKLLWVQFLYLFIGATLIIKALFWMPEAGLSNRFTNIVILLFFMFMVSGICRASFYGVTSPHKKLLAALKARLREVIPSPLDLSPEEGVIYNPSQSIRTQPASARLVAAPLVQSRETGSQ